MINADFLVVAIPFAVLVWAALSLLGMRRELRRPSAFKEEE